MPVIRVWPSTAYVRKSSLERDDDHWSPTAGSAVRIGFIPNVNRSSAVTKRFRWDAGTPVGPRGGNVTDALEVVVPQRFVSRSRRLEKPYVPTALIGPVALCSFRRAVPLTTASTTNRSVSGVFRCFVFVQRNASVESFASGKKSSSVTAGSGAWVVLCSSAIMTGAFAPPL